MRELLGRVVPAGTVATIRSDEHHAYPRAIRALESRNFMHETTSSKASRTPKPADARPMISLMKNMQHRQASAWLVHGGKSLGATPSVLCKGAKAVGIADLHFILKGGEGPGMALG